MQCAGCGKKLDLGGVPATTVADEFCGPCNEKYYREAEEAKRSEEDRAWARLVKRHGEEGAAEIWAEMRKG